MMVNKNTQILVKDLVASHKFVKSTSSDSFKISKTASNLAFLYEKARNAVEFRDEHQVRQAAIERILKRRLFLNQETNKIARSLVKELTWAKYMPGEDIKLKKVDEVEKTIDKYRVVLNQGSLSGYADRIIGILSCEIEEKINFNPTSQILTNFVSTSLFKRIDIESNDLKLKSILIYIAVERSFSKNNDIFISYMLLKIVNSKWQDKSELIEALKTIDNYLKNPINEVVKRKVSQMIAPFNLLREIVYSNIDNIEKVVENEELLDKTSKELLDKRYSETRDKVIRASKRSIIYIFLTKMFLAILVEIPFEILFSRINYIVLLINILFPPSLMILFNSNIKLPNQRNTDLMLIKLKEYLYGSEDLITPETIRFKVTPSKTDRAFFYLFITTSTLSIIGLMWFLNLIGFSPISQLIFLFFLSVVSFFAFRVREISKEYQMSDSYNDSFFETLLDYLFLPVVKVGQFLSTQISKLNILSFIFDFIIEAPLKSFLEILEDWLRFVRLKKEEILS